MNPAKIATQLLESDPEVRRIARSGLEHVQLKERLEKYLDGLGLYSEVAYHAPGGYYLVYSAVGQKVPFTTLNEFRKGVQLWLYSNFPNHMAGAVRHLEGGNISYRDTIREDDFVMLHIIKKRK